MKTFVLFSFLLLSVEACPQISQEALYFDGTSDLVLIPPSSSYLFGTGDFTVEAWIVDEYPPGNSFDFILANVGTGIDDSSFGFHIRYGRPSMFLNGNHYSTFSSIDVQDSACHHVAAVRQSGTLYFYADGIAIGSVVTAGESITNNEGLKLGGGPSPAFWGKLKEVRLWNVARTASQIQTNMYLTSGLGSNLIGYWRCNETSGGIVNDYALGNYGTMGVGCGSSCFPDHISICCASTCFAPTNLYVTNLTSTSAKLHWTIQACAVGYRIQYRPLGTSSWTNKNQNNNIGGKTISGLLANTTYQWRVKTKCSINPLQYSAYTAIQTFTTPLRLGKAEEEPLAVSISPNPFSTFFTITLNREGLPAEASAQAGEFAFMLYDVFGREVFRSKINDHRSKIERGNLPSGIYFYRVEEEGKLIGCGKVVIE